MYSLRLSVDNGGIPLDGRPSPQGAGAAQTGDVTGSTCAAKIPDLVSRPLR